MTAPLSGSLFAAHNLPAHLTSFVGREREIEEAISLLTGSRLLTLVGTGGAGKTRLSLHVGATLAAQGRYDAGVRLVELAALTDPAHVSQAVALSLGLREEAANSQPVEIAEQIGEQSMLLLLDNCEHLLAACGLLAGALLQACPNLHMLATSREPLGIAGETVLNVPSLSLPEPGNLPPPERLVEYEAVRLFVERAQFKRSGFAITEANAPHVAGICRALDGLPLAIELAAARTSVLSPEEIEARLDERFRLLTAGSREALPRHRTLRAAIDWSYELLDTDERDLLARLAVFPGSFDLQADAAVCAPEGTDEYEAIDLLARLADKSLLVVEDGRAESRYRLLDTIRHYAWERLEASGELRAVRERHLRYYLVLAEEARAHLQGPNQRRWFDRIQTEYDNMRAGLEWGCMDEGEGALRLAVALWRFWYVRGYISEGRYWLERALECSQVGDTGLKAHALADMGTLASDQGDGALATRLYGESLRLFRQQDDKQGASDCLNFLGVLARFRGDYEEARSLIDESKMLQEELGSEAGVAKCLNNLGTVAIAQGDYNEAGQLIQWSYDIVSRLRDEARVAIALNNLGHVAKIQGNYARARELYEQSLAMKQELGAKEGKASSLLGLGEVAYLQGDYETARPLVEESVELFRSIGSKEGIALALTNLGEMERCRGDYERALAHGKDALAAARDFGSKDYKASALGLLGRAALGLGRYREAVDALLEALSLAGAAGTRGIAAHALIYLAALLRLYGDPARGVRLLAAVEAYIEWSGLRLHPADEALRASEAAAVQTRAGRQVWEEARAMPLHAAIELALANREVWQKTPVSPLPTAPATGKASRPAGLTRREAEVLQLLAGGLSDAQIAERLFLSTNTVHAHIHSIYGKLDVASRAGAIRFALDNGLA